MSEKAAMKRNITIKVAGQEYELTAESPEHESILRDAAKIVNRQVDKVSSGVLTGKDSLEIIVMAAFTISTGYVMQNRLLKKTEEEETRLHKEIKGYLDNIDKISR